ncbi:MAG: RNA polymerase sigma-70 factor [Bacteroidaceae bacterium]|nr:RNA polymerase sigma-70 factor [Bacteroidaceae bacterium]
MEVNKVTEETNLLFALSKGKREAFDVLFKRYYPMLCAYARRIVEQEDAEEIVQEIMIWLWENRSRLTIESSLSQYLIKMTHNRSLNLIAKNEASARAEVKYYTKHQMPSEDIQIWQIEELSKKIEEAINALPETYRTAFIMHRFKGMSYKEIAEILQVSPKTVDYRIQQALKILRTEFKDYLPLLHFILQFYINARA